MCKELDLIQTHLGIWKLEDWYIGTSIVQIGNKHGIYCVKNLINNKLLIGEGIIRNRLNTHLRPKSNHSNRQWMTDIKQYNKDNFKLIWIIEENNEIQRKLIENKLQIYFKDSCYNSPRREYPTREQLINDLGSTNVTGKIYENITTRLNNYIKVQRVNGFDKCWEPNLHPSTTDGYRAIRFKKYDYMHHVLMYILHYGDICGISSVIHHKCANKKCVNPKHLELVTNIINCRIAKNCGNTESLVQSLQNSNLSTVQKSNMLKISKETIRKYTNYIKTSKYTGVYFDKQQQSYGVVIKIDNKTKRLGFYREESQAAQNRDYYIVKNNLLHLKQSTLNFHDIDYNNFKPFLNNAGYINKNLL